MARPRKKDRHLPPCVYHRHGAYYLVTKGRWLRLSASLPDALAEYGRRVQQPGGGMVALIDEAMPGILRGKAESTQKQYREAAKRLQGVLQEFGADQVTPRHVAQIRRAMAEGGKYAMANRMLSVLRMVFDYALEEQLVDANPCVGVRRLPQKARTRRLLPAEFLAIRKHAKPRLAVVMDLCYLTGQRVGDVLGIRRTDLQDDGVYFRQQKTGAQLVVRWTPQLRAAVEAAKALHGPVAGLHLVKGTVGQEGRPLSYHVIWKDWRAACEKAGVEDANVHDLRAMAGTEAEAQGHDAQKLLGHTDRKMTRRYLRDRTVPVVEGPDFGQSKTPGKAR